MRYSLVVLLLVGVAVLAMGQKSAPQKLRPTPQESGVVMFSQYCASCHGKDLKGSGPAAVALKVPPPDLTTLALRHGGKFPSEYVAASIRNGGNRAAHGSAEMPVWGPDFLSLTPHDPTIVTVRISNLTRYIKSRQQ